MKILLGHNNLWLMILICTVFMPLYTLYKILTWSMNNWSKHPITQNLKLYCNHDNNNDNHLDRIHHRQDTSWTTIASDINTEYRR